MQTNIVKHPEQAPEGRRRIEWAKNHMPVLGQLESEFLVQQPFKGLRVLVCVHLEAKTAYLAEVFKSGGAEVAVTGSNPDSTNDSVVAALAEAGLSVYAARGATPEDMSRYMNMALDLEPNVVIDDGGDIVELLHNERKALASSVLGACEETTTGVLRAQARDRAGELKFPVMLINEARCKFLFDNYHGTGQSVWDAVMRTTNLSLCGKTIAIVGFGWCGKGCAERAKGLGADVLISETDSIKAIEGVMQGYRVMPLLEACRQADFVLTVTGGKNVITKEHFDALPDGAVVANAGHFSLEIDMDTLRASDPNPKEVRDNITAYEWSGKRLYVLGGGNIVNIACGDGHPAEIMDISFSLQALSATHLIQNGDTLENKAYVVPDAIDQEVAQRKLKAMGVAIDALTSEQAKFLSGWTVHD